MQGTQYQTPIAVNARYKTELKTKLAEFLDQYSEFLTDEELKSVLTSLMNIGWKQEDGTWRRL